MPGKYLNIKKEMMSFACNLTLPKGLAICLLHVDLTKFLIFFLSLAISSMPTNDEDFS